MKKNDCLKESKFLVCLFPKLISMAIKQKDVLFLLIWGNDETSSLKYEKIKVFHIVYCKNICKNLGKD